MLRDWLKGVRTYAALSAAGVLQFSLLSEVLERRVRALNLRSVTDEQGHALPFHHDRADLLVGVEGINAPAINFLLDATLGLINIEQNGIIKIFSVAAVVFLPPTLVASVYGMNFQHMPELNWQYGYPMAVALMCLSAVLPWLYFKQKGWL